MSVCLSARISQQLRVRTSKNFSRDCGHGSILSDDNVIHYVLPAFADDVIFAHNRPGKGDASRAYAQSDSPAGSTGAKSDVSDCLV